ncbi:MAG: cell division protein [Caulobacterales bacterium]|nr:cell division protein [Caulobacterales bacterium]
MTNIFTHRIRGFRTLNIVFGVTLLVLAVGVNLAKTLAGRERNEIGQVESDMSKERQRIRVLEAEVAHLEQPERLERLSRAYLAMAPVQARQEATIEALPEVAGHLPRAQTISTPGVVVP